MFDIRQGRKNKRRDKRATRYLKHAQRLGIADATPLLAAGDGEHDRVHVLMQLGDPGAAKTIASVMHDQSKTDRKIAALRIAATQDDPNAMNTLAWSLNGNGSRHEIGTGKMAQTGRKHGSWPPPLRVLENVT